MAKRQNYGVTFVPCNLSAEDKKAFLTWNKKESFPVETLISDMLSKGMKLSISFDEENSTHIVSTTCKNNSSPNHNLCVVSRHADIALAVALAWYKIVEVLPDNWAAFTEEADWG